MPLVMIVACSRGLSPNFDRLLSSSRLSDRNHCPRHGVLNNDDLLVRWELTVQAHDGRAACTIGILSRSLPRFGDRLVKLGLAR